MRNGMSMERKMDAPVSPSYIYRRTLHFSKLFPFFQSQYGGLRKGLLGVYTIVLALFVVVLILLVVLAPIEKLFG